MVAGNCSTCTLQACSSCFTESGSGKFAGKYSRAASGNLGSTTLSQRVMERVNTSQSEAMYCRTGPKPVPVCAVDIPGRNWKANKEMESRTETQVELDRGLRSMVAHSYGG